MPWCTGPPCPRTEGTASFFHASAPACYKSAHANQGVVRAEGGGGKGLVHVVVRENNVDQALKALKKKMQREGVFREMKMRRHYEKPSERRARERSEAVRRARKLARKRAQREE